MFSRKFLPLFSITDTSLLYALRSRTADIFKANFRNIYGNIVSCPLLCWEESEAAEEDTQKNLLTCRKLKSDISSTELVSSMILYEDIFADTKKRKVIVDIFSKLTKARLKILKEKDNQPPGDDLDPSCVDSVFTSLDCINCVVYRIEYILIRATKLMIRKSASTAKIKESGHIWQV